MKEVHHRVKNNLNVIVSLPRLQEDQIDSVESARDAFELSRLDISRAIPCGIILNELLVNSVKHAFGEGTAHTTDTILLSAGDRYGT